ncbi:hypothetical protein IF188_09615 [Microbacterium sp. NEAU-LLC]|uniref:Phage virion morphogenesis protein n=1 Tax=Microbacterium helvum TaxID=2773713 RepID=A0ABR8NSC8_9MICO|nr:hypothetical protein [Microbacterium helvum]MBD3941951.1 hypothetical protein [Microbacterium helvum]
MLKIVDVNDSMGNLLLSLQRAESDTQDEMRGAADQAVESSWVPALQAASSGAQQTKLLVSGARADVDDLGFTLIAGTGPSLSGGLDSSHWYAVDYGMTPKRIAAPNRRRTIRMSGGRTFQAATLIWVGRNLPPRNAKGRVIYPTIGTKSQDYVTAWVEGLMGQFDDPVFDTDEGDVISQVGGSWQ